MILALTVTSKPAIISREKNLEDCLKQGLTIKAPMCVVCQKKCHAAQDNINAVLGEDHVPLVASGKLDGVRCLSVGCWLGDSGLTAAPSAHQRDAPVFAVRLKVAQVCPPFMVFLLRWLMSHTPGQCCMLNEKSDNKFALCMLKMFDA